MPTARQEVPLGAPPALVKYGITADEAHRFGLPCGGTLELLLEYAPDAGRSTRWCRSSNRAG